MKQIGAGWSSGKREVETDVGPPHQRDIVVAVGDCRQIGTLGRLEQHPLVWQSHVEVCPIFHGLGCAPLQAAAPVSSMPGQSFSENLDQYLDVRHSRKAWRLGLEPGPQGVHDAQAAVRDGQRHAVAALLMLAALIPFLPVAFLFFHRPGSASSLATQLSHAQTSGEAIIYSAHLREYFEPWYANPLVPKSIKQWEFLHLHGSNFVENSLALGYTVLALAAAGVLWARRWFVISLGVALMFVGALVALPPDQQVGPFLVHPPTYFLTQVVTIFRVYARFAMMVQLGVCLLAGLGMAVLQSRLGAGRRQLLLAIPFMLMAVEFNNLPPTHVTQILPAPAEYVWLRDQPQGIVMEYPAKAGGETSQQEIQIRQYLLYQMVHLHPTFLTEVTDGQVGNEAKLLEPYYGPGVVDQLKAYGVKYVLVHRSDYSADGYDVPQNVPGLTYVTTLGGTDIFTVN